MVELKWPSTQNLKWPGLITLNKRQGGKHSEDNKTLKNVQTISKEKGNRMLKSFKISLDVFNNKQHKTEENYYELGDITK